MKFIKTAFIFLFITALMPLNTQSISILFTLEANSTADWQIAVKMDDTTIYDPVGKTKKINLLKKRINEYDKKIAQEKAKAEAIRNKMRAAIGL